jgi:hypothetical protein
MTHRAMPFIVGAIALTVAAAGGAYAASAPSGNAITACVHHNGGGLYLAKKCHKHDKSVTWNKVGPAGRNGTNGTNGTNGKNGTNGTDGTNGTNGIPAVADYAADSHEYEFTPATSAFERIITLSLPAGSYSITGTVNLEAADPGDATATYEDECELIDGSNSEVEYQAGVTNGPLDVARGTLSFGLVITTTATSEAVIQCQDLVDGGNGSFNDFGGPSQLSAVRVQSIDNTLVPPV